MYTAAIPPSRFKTEGLAVEATGKLRCVIRNTVAGNGDFMNEHYYRTMGASMGADYPPRVPTPRADCSLSQIPCFSMSSIPTSAVPTRVRARTFHPRHRFLVPRHDLLHERVIRIELVRVI